MNKPTEEPELLLEIAELFKIARQEGALRRWADGKKDAGEVLAKVQQHYKQKAKGMLEEIESRWGWAFDKDAWQAFKREVLGGK